MRELRSFCSERSLGDSTLTSMAHRCKNSCFEANLLCVNMTVSQLSLSLQSVIKLPHSSTPRRASGGVVGPVSGQPGAGCVCRVLIP